jgi:uncharacterized protein YwqG
MITSLNELLRTAGLTRVGKEIERVALPSIRLIAHRADEAHLRLGTTKIGGSPDLPQGRAWPASKGSALPFVAQINLSDVVPYDTEHLLPASGLLYFFFDVDVFFETWPRDWHTWSVILDRSPISALQRVAMPDGAVTKRRYRSTVLTCSPELTLPDYSQYDSTSRERLGLFEELTAEEEQAYYDVQSQLAGGTETKRHRPLHRLLGHADPVQWDMHSELPGEAADWRLLFQLDSDSTPHTKWGNTGRIYYWIRTKDLQQGDFNQAQLILQST